jgi:hypothetical protein
MNYRRIGQSFIVYFVLVFIVNALVTFLYNTIFHGTSLVDWESSLRFAVLFGVVFPVAGELERSKK